ncbi:MAG: MOSC domain-containing protein [Proteobacteria bacterium]|nr:MOSC domain-containing protein [Pseudomonadota bacterium]MCH8058551.1 MOSC domain-containing protein [Pseudomonadota bacterium]
MPHATMEKLDAGLDEVRRSPKDDGVLKMIVRRPGVDKREVLEEAELSQKVGLVGDSWSSRATRHWTPHPDTQLTLMNSRAATLVAQDRDRWPLAGDQLYIDLDLSVENLPPGTRLSLGTAIIEVTDQAHTGCSKFAARFGKDAMEFVNSPVGRELNLRGINARVTQPGRIRVGDIANRI